MNPVDSNYYWNIKKESPFSDLFTFRDLFQPGVFRLTGISCSGRRVSNERLMIGLSPSAVAV